jgi:hypothetical protein
MDAISGPAAKAAATDVFAEVSASLRRAGIVVGVIALLVALGAYLAGRPPWLMALIERARRATAARPGGSQLQVWVARNADTIRIASVLVAAVVLFLTGIDWLPVAIVGVLLALVLWQVAVASRSVVIDVSEPSSDETGESDHSTPAGREAATTTG